MELSISNDGDATFDRLFGVYQRFVYGFCFRMTRNVEDAKDLTQEVFLKLYTNQHKIREGSLQSWLGRVAFRDSLRHLARRRRCPSLDDMLEQRVETLRSRISIRDHVVSRVSVDEALRKLPARRRICFQLKYFHGYEHQEIARIMGCVPGTSKSNCSRACATVLMLLGLAENEP